MRAAVHSATTFSVKCFEKPLQAYRTALGNCSVVTPAQDAHTIFRNMPSWIRSKRNIWVKRDFRNRLECHFTIALFLIHEQCWVVDWSSHLLFVRNKYNTIMFELIWCLLFFSLVRMFGWICSQRIKQTFRLSSGWCFSSENFCYGYSMNIQYERNWNYDFRVGFCSMFIRK